MIHVSLVPHGLWHFGSQSGLASGTYPPDTGAKPVSSPEVGVNTTYITVVLLERLNLRLFILKVVFCKNLGQTEIFIFSFINFVS